MKVAKNVSVALLSSLLALPVIAEPMWRQASDHKMDAGKASAENYRIGRVAGMEKYTPYSERYKEVSVDTEIAAFEEVKDTSSTTKPLRSDRIPRVR